MKRLTIFAGLLSAACLFLDVARADQPLPEIPKAFISFRVGTSLWMRQERYEELLAMFARHRGVTDEITFFQSATHSPLPLEENQKRFEVLAQRVAQARKLGYRSGINILATTGHHEENLPNSVGDEYGRVIDFHGTPLPRRFVSQRSQGARVCRPAVCHGRGGRPGLSLDR